jgi:hypothetical protein
MYIRRFERDCTIHVRHVSRLRRSEDLHIPDPVLTDWANFCRASGAGLGSAADRA